MSKRCGRCGASKITDRLCVSCRADYACYGREPQCCRCAAKGAVTKEDIAQDIAHARRTDPQTSHEAAASLSTDRLRFSQGEVLWLLKTFGPMTDTELVRVAATKNIKQSPSGLRTRRKELVTKGKVENSGLTEKLPSGRASIIWRAVL